MLWLSWWSMVRLLRPAFSRERAFLWFATSLAAITIRSDLAGVTSFVRALGLSPRFYGRLLDNFHSTAINLDKLTALWAAIVFKTFPGIVRVKGRPVVVGDGIKAAKEGKKMPGVKCLHQEAGTNSKPPYIMGHSCQALAVLATVAGYFFAVPLVCRIHEGIVLSNRDSRTLLDKLLSMLKELMLPVACYVVLDAYYAARKTVFGLIGQGHHLICRVKPKAVAYRPAVTPAERRRGRPKVYGDKVTLRELFVSAVFTPAPSPVYGEENVEILYHVVDLIWKPVGRLVRFVLVKHPTRGKRIFMSTDLLLPAIEIIELYGLRFKIEVAFKQSVYTIGTYAYHFWMKAMTPIKRRSGEQYLHRKGREYRDGIVRKLRAYHSHMQLGVIAQGLLQYIAMMARQEVWNSFGSWLRTIRPDVLPSEAVVTVAMRNTIEEFLDDAGDDEIFVKFVRDRQEGRDETPRKRAVNK